MDLNLSAAGVNYGASRVTEPALSSDVYDLAEGFRNSIKSMGTAPAKTSENFQFTAIDSKYLEWVKKFSPIGIIKFYSK